MRSAALPEIVSPGRRLGITVSRYILDVFEILYLQYLDYLSPREREQVRGTCGVVAFAVRVLEPEPEPLPASEQLFPEPGFWPRAASP